MEMGVFCSLFAPKLFPVGIIRVQVTKTAEKASMIAPHKRVFHGNIAVAPTLLQVSTSVGGSVSPDKPRRFTLGTFPLNPGLVPLNRRLSRNGTLSSGTILSPTTVAMGDRTNRDQGLTTTT